VRMSPHEACALGCVGGLQLQILSCYFFVYLADTERVLWGVLVVYNYQDRVESTLEEINVCESICRTLTLKVDTLKDLERQVHRCNPFF
jgi:hypothetical protein